VNKSLYNNADATLASTHELIEAIKKNPKKYLTIHLKLF
jgi:phospholipid/cholesterol/gamma-HCH transport system substrate-binding protein